MRTRKAKKVYALVSSCISGEECTILDVGTGSGTMAAYFKTLNSNFDVHAIDVCDQRTISGNYHFSLYDGETFPFKNKKFDLVFSNHVIEHINGRQFQAAHVREILRVLAPGGTAYLACPNRWQFIEPHFRLPALSWLPRALRGAYVRVVGKGSNYDCDPLSLRELESVLSSAGAQFESAIIAAARIFAEEPNAIAKLTRALLTLCPTPILRGLRPLSPTLVYLIRHA